MTKSIPGSQHNLRTVSSPRGNQITAKSWLTEAPMRMLMNNLDSNVAENPQQIEAHTASRIFLYKFVGSSMSSTLCDKTIIPKTTRRLPVINVGLRGALRSKVCQMSVVRGKVPVRVRVLDTPISFRAIIYNVSPSATPRLNAANIRNH